MAQKPPTLTDDPFVSCLYIHIDLAGRRLHLAGAGHPPPLLRSR
ncbi:SpoIIE family protein phosphatase [Streptomyces europaeiscabiei]|uniref:SpoIIE family protein phosphatase n=1 Tax=Streptomyces europaeiscabiei TaxID=146819 RepID=A0AAJ2UJT8_9ACTN|nr:SpoIIE family protein phosphatase [Streptomyces europaeiscabiei]MDX3129209.1 SpoIIE family protein phosphatase [Streptomyces europaeiscabiei]